MDLALAIALMAERFVNKVDKAGEPYILHILRVMNGLHTRDKERQIIAVFHDGPEDKVITIEEIRSLGFSERVITAVKLLTHDKENVAYQDYIKALAHNEDARLVKLSDLRDNSDITRLKGLTKKDFDRMEKYHAAYTYLSKV